MEMSKKIYSKPTLKFFLALILCLFARLIPFRVPNVEPILATAMPFSKVSGALVSFSFVVLSILLYDITTHTLGVQTFFTAGAYGLVILYSSYYFKKHKGSRMDYVRFAIIGTLLFDAMTGLTIGPIFFHQSFMNSLIGQIPFTLFHLAGNIVFAYTLSPAIYNFLIRKKVASSATRRKGGKIEIPLPTSILNPKII